MKKILLVTATLIGTIVIMAFNGVSSDCSVQYSSGTPAGYCGDPAGGYLTCNTAGCHIGGPTPTLQTGWVTSNIPTSGYVPNSTYTITATATGAGHTKFGFEISPQNSNGTTLGTLVNTSSETQIVGINNNYITHTITGTSGIDSKIWTFNWTAPPTSLGNVTFYGAFNISNMNNTMLGDTILTSQLTVFENTTGIATISSNEQTISIFPNPFFMQTTIEADNLLKNATLTMDNCFGQTVKEIKNISGQTVTLFRDNLQSGLYFLRLTENNKIIATKKIVITDN